MHGRRRHDLADQLEQGVVPDPGDRAPAEVGSLAAGDVEVRAAGGARPGARGATTASAPTHQRCRHAPDTTAVAWYSHLPEPRTVHGGRPVWFNPTVRAWASVSAIGATVAHRHRRRPRQGARRRRPPSVLPHFVEETGAIDHRYAGDFQYFVGGGVAAFDCDDDGRSDLFFAGGSEPAALYHNDSAPGGALRFTPLPSPVTDLTAVTGAYPLDIDGDGHIDLVVLRVGEDVVLRGLGDCRFERANESLGFDGGDTWTVAFSATWEGDNDVADAGVRRLPRAPTARDCEDSRLVRPDAGGGGYAAADRPVTRLLHAVDAVQRLEPIGAARPADDQRPALLPRRVRAAVAASSPGRAPTPYTEADGWRPLQIWGMGIASAGPHRRRLSRRCT